MGSLAVHLRTALALTALAALPGCPTVDLGDTPADIGSCRPDRDYFEQVIWPMYIAPADEAKSCIAQIGCHNDSLGARSGMHLKTTMPIDYTTNYRTVSRHLNCSDPSASDMLTYPTQLLPHPVMLFGASDPEVTQVFLPWFDQ